MNGLSIIVDILMSYLEIFFLYRIVDYLIPRRKVEKNPNQYWILLMVLITIHVIIVFSLNRMVLTSPYTTIILLIFDILVISLFWKCDLLISVAMVGSYYCSLFIVALTQISITGMIGGEELIEKTTMEQGLIRFFYVLICGSMWVTIDFLFYRWLKKKNINQNSFRYLAVLSIIGIIGFVFIAIQMLTSFNVTLSIGWYIFLVFLSIVIFVTYFIVKSKNLTKQLQLLTSQNDILERNYEQINDYYTANAKYYHDLKHHFTALQYMLENGKNEEAKVYLTSLKNPVESYSITHWTGIDVIDTILSDKMAIAKKYNIEMKMNIQLLPFHIGIEKRDLCAIFANLLDNAIEASPKKIEVLVKIVHEMLLIQIHNDYQIEPNEKNGKFLTRKTMMLQHGWGIQSVESVVRKYNGSMNISTKEEMFCVDIIINI